MAETIKFGNYIYEHGYTMVSNLLVDYQDELGLSNDELMFIIKVYRHKNGYKLHDGNLDSTLSTKTLQRRRKSLVDKGMLKFTVHKSNDENGSIITEGIVYDFTALDIMLMQLSSEILEKNAAVKITKEETAKAEKKADYYSDFKDEYKKRYGKEYNITSDEKQKLKSLKKDQKEAIKYLFDYMDDNIENLPEDFHPRLSFFIKLDWRMEKLVEYAELKQQDIISERDRLLIVAKESVATEKYKSMFIDEKDESGFKKYLSLYNRPLMMKERNGMKINTVDELEKEYKKYKGV